MRGSICSFSLYLFPFPKHLPASICWTFLHVKPNMYRPTFPFSPAALFLQGAEVRHISARADLLFSDPLLSTALSSPVNGNCLRPCEILCPTPSQNPWFCYDNHTSLRQFSGPDSKCVTSSDIFFLESVTTRYALRSQMCLHPSFGRPSGLSMR